MSDLPPDQPPDSLPPSLLPTGTVTFLFSDIEGSTKLLQRLGDRYAEVLADHQRLLRQAWADHDGAEVDTQGDSFFVVFSRATDALAAAAQAQRALAEHEWPAGEHVRVRMGLHTGIGTLSHDHYVGLDVHRAARIAAAGNGGQVLLSQATRDQVAKELVAGAGLRDLGKHRLKDLPRREEIYQLVLPGLPADYPPLKTLDAWPGLRADLMVVALLSVAALAVAGLLLPLVVRSFPRAIGLGAAGLAALLLATSGSVRPVRRALLMQWRDARKPFSAVTSALLCLVVVVTTLFITKPPIFIRPPHVGYDFSYTYHQPTHTGGSVVIGEWYPNPTLIPYDTANFVPVNAGLWDTCLTQLPDLTLGLDSYKPDQCTAVPTVDNGGEDPLGRWTIFKIDPRAVWSDGTPITADDYRFAFRLQTDPNVGLGQTPVQMLKVSALDPHTVRIDWAAPFSDYLTFLSFWELGPLPLHVYAAGRFAGVYNPTTDTYNSALAQQLVRTDSFRAKIPVDSGPFVEDLTRSSSQLDGGRLVVTRNPRFFSNYFHRPALDQVTFVNTWDQKRTAVENQDALIGLYRTGQLTVAESLDPTVLQRLAGLPKNEIVTSPQRDLLTVWLDQFAAGSSANAAPNAQANGGESIFDDITVRKAFVEAFDRCAAFQAELPGQSCKDPNLHTDEWSAPPAPDFDGTITFPNYNSADAARLMDRAGYPVVDGVRRYRDGKTPIHLTISTFPVGNPIYDVAVKAAQNWTRNLDISVIVKSDLDQPPPSADTIVDEEQFLPTPVGITLGTYLQAEPQATALDQLGTQTVDAQQRAKVYQRLQRYVANQYYVVPVLIFADVSLAKPTLCNFKKWPAQEQNTWNLADWYVASTCAS